MFWCKSTKKIVENNIKNDKDNHEDKPSEILFFNGMIKCTENKGSIKASITDEGTKFINNIENVGEILVAIDMFENTHVIDTQYHLAGYGTMCTARSFLAYKTLISAFNERLKTITKD